MEFKNNWLKKGVIFNADNTKIWIYTHAYIPTPILLDEETIRIFFASRDKNNIGRIGFIDVKSKNPMEIIGISDKPCLDIGHLGTFDDNGVTPITIINNNGKLYLYYAGWQLSDKVRYFIFAGLAISNDMGKSFQRLKNVPLLERTDEEFLVRTAPGILVQNNQWNMIYCGGGKNIIIDGKITPSYSLKYLKSNDGINWGDQPIEIFTPTGLEYGFGRPDIHYENDVYKMWYSIRRQDKKYTLGYAESRDMINWNRMDNELGSLTSNLEDYETEMQCFCALLKTKYGNYIFYNGNEYGKTGICFAVQKS